MGRRARTVHANQDGADVKKTEMRALLYSRLAEVFGDTGFRVVKKQEGLVRKTPTGTQKNFCTVLRLPTSL